MPATRKSRSSEHSLETGELGIHLFILLFFPFYLSTNSRNWVLIWTLHWVDLQQDVDASQPPHPGYFQRCFSCWTFKSCGNVVGSWDGEGAEQRRGEPRFHGVRGVPREVRAAALPGVYMRRVRFQRQLAAAHGAAVGNVGQEPAAQGPASGYRHRLRGERMSRDQEWVVDRAQLAHLGA